ncbi:MAG TPA: hypothetical protein DD649_15980 [Providencia sp.]|nr:hypothetical protein [Providencia sp.]
MVVKMSFNKLALLLIFISFISQAEVTIHGNKSIEIIGEVVEEDNFEVTDGNGGWYNELELKQQEINSPYQVDARVHVLSTNPNFMVTLQNIVVLRNDSKGLSFAPAEVIFSSIQGETKKLKPMESQSFTNPDVPVGADSEGEYTLSISANAPIGSNQDISGAYVGEIALIFEPSASD